MRIDTKQCSQEELLEKYHPGDRVGATRSIEDTRFDFQTKFNEEFGPYNYLATLYYTPTNNMRRTEDILMNESVEGVFGCNPVIQQLQYYSNAPQAPGYVYVLHLTFRFF